MGMARLIDVDALAAHFRRTKIDEVFPNWKELFPSTQSAIIRLTTKYRAIVLSAPIVDAVPVVRCKGCAHWLPEELERCKALKQKPYGWCNRYPQRTDWQDTTYEDDF